MPSFLRTPARVPGWSINVWISSTSTPNGITGIAGNGLGLSPEPPKRPARKSAWPSYIAVSASRTDGEVQSIVSQGWIGEAITRAMYSRIAGGAKVWTNPVIE